MIVMYSPLLAAHSIQEGPYMRNRIDIKLEAKSILRANLLPLLTATALVLVTAEVLTRIVNLLTYGTLVPELQQFQYLLRDDPLYGVDPAAFEAATTLVARNTSAAYFFSILTALFLAVLWGGYYLYCMGVRQGMQMPYSTLFDGLAVAGRLIWCQILVWVFAFLWSMLFFFPGIIAVYRYRFAFYNILTDHTLSANQAISLSCKQTRGRKMDLFVLDLSFLGWNILSSMTLGLLDIWVRPYMTLCALEYFAQAQLDMGRPPYGSSVSMGEDPWSTE